MRLFVLVVSVMVLISCGESDREKGQQNLSIIKSAIEIKSGTGNYNLTSGSTFSITAENLSANSLSQIALFVNDSLFFNPTQFPFDYEFSTDGLRLGKNRLKITAMNGSTVESKTVTFTVLAKAPPVEYTFRILNSYEHDEQAYTQGLIYHEGYIYEGTGQKGLSSLRKINLTDAKIIERVDLDQSIFGEGIAILGDYVYQLSWISKVGFVYSLSDLTEIRRFYYDDEGWGLTTDGEFLIKSNGSSRITFHAPSDFRELNYIEVYSDKHSIERLNELEYINGKIWANIWQTDEIAIIDPGTGRLEGLIDLKGLLPEKDRDRNTDVLNGIAYNAESNTVYVTGKYWSKIFEIEIVPKKTAG